MKRTAILIIIILLTLGVSVAMLWPFFEPDLKKAEFSFSTNYDGEIYLSESHEDCSFLYKVDKEGNVGNILKLDGIISGTLSLKDSVYFVSTTYDFSQGWSLMEADANLKEAHEVARGDFDQFGSVYTLSSDENRVYLTFTDSAGKRILVLSYTPGADGMTGEGLVGVENMDVHMEWTFTDGNTAVDYVCDGESILALLSTGEVARITKGGAEYTDELFTNSTLRCRDGRVVLLNKNTREVFVEENFPNFSRNRVYENLNVRGFAMVEEEVILLASRSDGSANLYFSESASTNRWEAMPEMRVPIEKRASFVDYKSVKIWIIVVAIAIAMIVSAMIAVYVRRLVVRVCATFAAVGCFMLAVMCVLVFITSGEVVLVEIDAASGNVAHEYLATEEVQASVTFTAFCYGAVALIGAVVIAFVFTIFSLRPMRDLAKRIERFVEGDFTVDGMVSAKGDLGKISRAVTEMGVSLAIKRYETDRMIDSYARFVPRDADRLLDRAGIMEICTGDIAEIDECIAIVSVENRVAVMREMDSHGFMTFVNSCFTRILEFAGKRGGTLLSGEFLESLPILFSRRLGAKKADAIRFGLDLIDRMSGGESDVPAPDFFLLLHKTDFLYGIAGTDKKSFPFISSAELNFLFGCNAPLRQLGIRMAATEQYLDSLTEDGSSGVADAYAKRHIGKITFADESRDYRLYEMLDCLSDRERDLRLNYDKRFQAAIDLFYRDAFYVAMVEFSSILKINPHDGLARWYAFACERYFDEGDHAKVRHQLLGFEGI